MCKSESMAKGAKIATDKFLHSQALPGSPEVDFVVASATECSSIPGEQEGTFDLVICVYMMCNLLSKDEVTMRMDSEREIKVTTRVYTLSSWMSWILEAGFQITEFMEPCVDPKVIPADASEYAKFAAGKPVEMCWECTKSLSR